MSSPHQSELKRDGKTSGDLLPLPRGWKELGENSISMYVTNISKTMSKQELEAMLHRAGCIVDSIPIDKINGKNRDIAFVSFKLIDKAERRGRRIQAKLPIDSTKKLIIRMPPIIVEYRLLIYIKL